jgi:hypothetical protein
MTTCFARLCIGQAVEGGVFCAVHWKELPHAMRRRLRQRMTHGVSHSDAGFAAAVNAAILYLDPSSGAAHAS